MSTVSVLIVSRDSDFAQPLAEQVGSELAVSCSIAPEMDQSVSPSLVVAHTAVGGYPGPVLVVGNPPFKMQALLAGIAGALQVESLQLGQGYELQLRQKQLTHSGKSVALTDKEAQLLQNLAEGKGGREQLLKNVWGMEPSLDTHTLETHIYRLRGKFRELGEDEMVMAEGGGYKLKSPSPFQGEEK